MKPTALVFRSELLPPSETFIAAQAAALRHYRPVFAGTHRRRPSLPLPGPVAATLSRAERLLLRHTGWTPRLYTSCRAWKPALVHAHFALDGAQALSLARRLAVPLIVTLHGYDVMRSDEAHGACSWGQFFLARRARLQREAALFLCVSEAVRKRALAVGYPAWKLRTLPIGIEAGPELSELSSEPNVLFVGRFVPKKGCSMLLRAFADLQRRLPNARLTIAGEGPERAALEAYAARHTRGTRFLGVQTPTQVRALMRGARCLAVPSETAPDGDAEGLPTVLCEALALGLPVASTWHSGIPELVTHGEHGLLAAEGDADSFARNLERLCTDRAFAEKLRAQGKEKVERSFNLNVQTGLLEELYDEVCRRPMYAATPALLPALPASSREGRTRG